jgi:peptidoglycan/xylan/chitin deacetylase (PgdA/CDA1 family)
MKRLLSRLLYACGIAGLYHRRRNRRALTVLAFHRVIAATDARWHTCDPLYTLSDRLFDQCMAFVSRHYSVVTLSDLERARASADVLPECPLLITFDDGWADNYDYALPALQRHRLPAALFVASDALDRREGFFQERIIAAWRGRRLSDSTLQSLWMKLDERAPTADLQSEASIRALIASLHSLPEPRRSVLLADIADDLADERRQMLTTEELRLLATAGVTVGTHGKRHEALTSVPDAETELNDSKTAVAAALAVAACDIDSLSFPFSKQNTAVVELARRAGYRLLFGGGSTLTPLHAELPDMVPRVGICAGDVQDANGNLIAHKLAAYLFRRPHRVLAPG